MRRKIGYLLLTGSVILGAATLVGPTINRMNTDITYGNGKDIVYKISKKNTTYGGACMDSYIKDDGEAVELVGNEMENRLKTWGIEAQVMKEGSDTIRVRVRSDKDVEYAYLTNYLSFSGGHFSVGASLESVEETPEDCWSDMFTGQKASINYVKVNTGEVPAMTIPINPKYAGENGKFNDLVNKCIKASEKAASSGDEQNKPNPCYLVVWSHRQEGDTYAKATAENADINMSKRLLFAEPATYAWRFQQDPDKEQEYKEFQIIPTSAALTDKGFDVSKADVAYMAAKYYSLLFNASDYAEIAGNGNGYDVTHAFTTSVNPLVEPLVDADGWHVHPAFKATAIASLVTLVFLIIIASSYFKLSSLTLLSSLGATLLCSLLLFGVFNAQFGIGALVGLIVTGCISLFGSIYYLSKVKEQLYQGRTAKKAHKEACKRAVWPTLDASIVSIITGLCIYGWVPGVVSKAGLMIVVGGFFAAVFNLFLTRLSGYFLANDSTTPENLVKYYNVNEEKVPNLFKEEKPSYYGAFAKKDFKKPSKGSLAIAASLGLASIIGIICFSTIPNTTQYNYSNTYSDTTISYIEYRCDPNDKLVIKSEIDLKNVVLDKITLNDKPLEYSNIVKEDTLIYDTEAEKNLIDTYYTIDWKNHFDPSKQYEFKVEKTSGDVITVGSLEIALTTVIDDNFPEGTAIAEVQNVRAQKTTPTLGNIWLGLGVGMLISTAYICIRYRLTRGLSAGVLSTLTGIIVCGFFVLTRIPVTPVVSLAAIATSLITMLSSLFILGKEKELYKDSRSRNKNSISFRTMCIETATAQSSEYVVLYSLLNTATALWFIGLGPQTWSMIHIGGIVGIVIGLGSVLFLLAPVATSSAKLMSKINKSIKPKKHHKKKDDNKEKSNEPEEALFIGIND